MSPGNSGCICLSDPHKHIDTTLLFHHYHQPLWPDFLQFEITTPLLVVGSNNTLEHTADTTVL